MKKIAIAAASAALVAGGTATMSSPAEAAGGLEVYQFASYAGQKRVLTKEVKNFTTITFNDMTSSIRNTTKVAWVVWTDKNFFGKPVCIKPGRSYSNLAQSKYVNDFGGLDNRISSAHPTGRTDCMGWQSF